MENNNQNQLPDEEIPNLEQFQVGRAPSAEEDQLNEDMDDLSGAPLDLSDEPDEEYDTEEVEDIDDADDTEDADDASYTEDEIEYADGEGTLLDDEIEDDEDEEI